MLKRKLFIHQLEVNMKSVYQLLLLNLFFLQAVIAQNVGIGLTNPQKNLSVSGGLNIDQANSNASALGTNSLTFGSNSGEGIASSRVVLTPWNDVANDLSFYTNNTERLRINKFGRIGINWPVSTNYASFYLDQLVNINHVGDYKSYAYNRDKHALLIADLSDIPNDTYDGGYLFFGVNRLNNLSYIQAERNNYGVNSGNTLLLQYRGNVTVGEVLSPTAKLEVKGDVKINSDGTSKKGDLTVRDDNGIIRNESNKQLLKQSKSVLINASFAAGETKFYDFVWPTAFTEAPEAYIGSIVSGGGGWAEVVMSVALVTTTGARLYVYNPAGTRSPNFSVNIMALGVQD